MLRYWPAACWTILIAVMYGLPASLFLVPESLDVGHTDKLVHITAFTCFTIVVLCNLHEVRRRAKFHKRTVAFTSFAIVCYGAAFELIQGTVFDGRQSDGWDFVANCIGVVIGLVIFGTLWNRKRILH